MGTPTSVTTATPHPRPNAANTHQEVYVTTIFQPIYNLHGMAVTPMKPGDNTITILARTSLARQRLNQ
jgi:hypothetical protein